MAKTTINRTSYKEYVSNISTECNIYDLGIKTKATFKNLTDTEKFIYSFLFDLSQGDCKDDTVFQSQLSKLWKRYCEAERERKNAESTEYYTTGDKKGQKKPLGDLWYNAKFGKDKSLRKSAFRVSTQNINAAVRALYIDNNILFDVAEDNTCNTTLKLSGYIGSKIMATKD